jgi:RecA-family ATPase
VDVYKRYEPSKPGDPPPIPGVLASDVTPQSLTWLWPNHIPLGKVTLLGGDPDLAKSTVSLHLAACVTQGLPMPDGTELGCLPAGMVIVSLEDGVGDTIRPRLEAAGAALEKVRIVSIIKGTDGIERTPTLPVDLPAIESAIHSVNAELVILDPLVAMLGAETRSYRDQDIWRVLAPVAALAERPAWPSFAFGT